MNAYFLGAKPYKIENDGSISVNDNRLEAHEYYWSSEHLCHQISNETAVEKFLGHPISDYRVQSLFDRLMPDWIQNLAEIIGLKSPKRK